jgi:hypothetical protein
MKARNMLSELLAIVLAVGMLAAICTVWGPRGVTAGPAPHLFTTGVFSLAQGQATSAHVVNTGEARGIVVNWTVFDSAGNTLAQSERRTVEPGQASTFEYRPPDLAEGQRMAIRLVLTVEGANRDKPGFIATQEVYNTGDGKTTVSLPYIEQ